MDSMTTGDAHFQRASPLLAGMPSRGRAIAESVFVFAVVLGGDLSSSWIVAAVLVAVGVGIVRPWEAAVGSVAARIGVALALVATIVLPAALSGVGQPRRIGVEIVASDGAVEVRKVQPGAPAEGRLFEGDRILAVDGAPLDAAGPHRDFIRRVQAAGEAVTLDVVRNAAPESVRVPVPRARGGPAVWRAIGAFAREHLLAGTVLRAVCVTALVLLLLRAAGQSPAVLGLVRDGAGRDALLGIALTAGAFATALASGLLVAGVAAIAHAGFVEKETAQRSGLLVDLFGDTPVGAFAAAMVVTATFEEVVFRGFLVPRLRHITGSWAFAIALSSLAFGSGHIYEGWTGVAQTAALGVFFSLAFLRRARLVPVVVAHASFNAVVFGLLMAMQRSGLLEGAGKALKP
jgi:membrane protease YdiL (CAAX protease family)